MTIQSSSETDPEFKTCPYCSEKIRYEAAKCKHCGEYLDPQLRQEREAVSTIPKWSPGVAAVLSFFIPGLGQMYKGQIINGLFWLGLVIIGYVLFIVPGLILHLLCIVGAASGDPTK